MNISLTQPARLPLDAFLAAVASRDARVELAPALRERLAGNRAFFEGRLAEGYPLYGVNTGFGNSSSERIGLEETLELQRNLTRYHGCGAGELLPEETSRAVVLARILCLAQARSGVSLELIDALSGLFNAGISPCIPALGSVGASGDLTPLSYLAAALQGERRVHYRGRVVPAAEALADNGLSPYSLKAKEGLALMNGTSVMVSVMALELARAKRFASLACEATALSVEILGGRVSPFREELHACKPHAGNVEASRRIFALLAADEERNTKVLSPGGAAREARLQDSYSLRCAPHVVGALFDAIAFAEGVLDVELHSVNDNPVVIHEEGLVLNGGHFFGSHVALACDMLKPAVASVAGLLDRQMAILVDGRLSNGLPDNLVDVASLGARAKLHHGLKALQISMSAVTAEALKATMPAAVFSRPTECLNQDVVSLGTIAARDLATVVDLASWTSCFSVFTLCQAARVTPEKDLANRLSESARAWLQTMGDRCAPLREDRALDDELAALRGWLYEGTPRGAC